MDQELLFGDRQERETGKAMSRFDSYCRKFRPSNELTTSHPLQIIITVISANQFRATVPTVPEIEAVGNSLQDVLDKLTSQANAIKQLLENQ